MMQSGSNAFRQVVAVILAVCVSTCCCQARFAIHGFGITADDCGVVSVSVPSCCQQCPADPASSTEDDEPTAPGSGCQECCIKGSGLKDAAATLPEIAVVTMPWPDTLATLGLPPAHEIASTIEATCPRVEPRTLLRLRCALLI